MEWIAGIQRAIDYIEAHLTEEIDIREAAAKAYASPFHFQRVFSIVSGFTVGEYIRMRRLTLAAAELSGGSGRVLDIALKYGYESPESFTRAFIRFHGITPTDAKLGRTVKAFSRLSVKLTLSGGSIMDYRIEKLGAFQVICKRRQVSRYENLTATADISAFWDKCSKDGTISKLCRYFPQNPVLKGMLGICFAGISESAVEFPYGIGVPCDGQTAADDDLEIVSIPPCTYAVFPCRGRLPDVFPEVYKRIITEFFPQNGRYEYGSGIEVEVYPSAALDDPEYACEIWIAVKEK